MQYLTSELARLLLCVCVAWLVFTAAWIRRAAMLEFPIGVQLVDCKDERVVQRTKGPTLRRDHQHALCVKLHYLVETVEPSLPWSSRIATTLRQDGQLGRPVLPRHF